MKTLYYFFYSFLRKYFQVSKCNFSYLHIRNFNILDHLPFCTDLYYLKIYRRNFRVLKIVSQGQKMKQICNSLS